MSVPYIQYVSRTIGFIKNCRKSMATVEPRNGWGPSMAVNPAHCRQVAVQDAFELGEFATLAAQNQVLKSRGCSEGPGQPYQASLSSMNEVASIDHDS